MNFSSKLIEEAVEAFSSLPGIGKKTALRLTLHLLKQDIEVSETIAQAIVNMRKNIKECRQCHNISDASICSICSNKHRDEGTICVVENIRDLMAIEDTGQYRGLYHVLGGIISPIEGIGSGDLNIETLKDRILTNSDLSADKKSKVKEIIMAISPTIEGDTTIFYITKQLKGLEVKVSTIARGVSFGGELEYADELTLGRSILTRSTYEIE